MFSPVAAMLWTPMIVIFREYTVSPCSPVFSDSCLRLYACIVLRFLCSLKWTRVQIKFNFFPFVFRFRNSCPVDRRAHNCLRKSVLALLYFAGVPGVSVWILRRLSYRKCTRPANSNRKTGFGKKKKLRVGEESWKRYSIKSQWGSTITPDRECTSQLQVEPHREHPLTLLHIAAKWLPDGWKTTYHQGRQMPFQSNPTNLLVGILYELIFLQ